MKKKNNNKKKYFLNEDELERRKTIYMWFGVSFFMSLIVIVWLYNLKMNFAKYKKDDNIEKNNFSLIDDDFNKKLDEIKKEFNKLNQEIASSSLELASSSPELDSQFLENNIKMNIEDASSTASSTNK